MYNGQQNQTLSLYITDTWHCSNNFRPCNNPHTHLALSLVEATPHILSGPFFFSVECAIAWNWTAINQLLLPS